MRRPVRSSCLIELGRIKVDGREVELVWSTLSDTVLADFSEVEPRRIGTAVIGGPAEPAFIAQPNHLDWLGYEDREARILRVAVRLYRQQPGN
ncbi:hypothetical protein [Glycomyces salinus]|uniref:hypothetical protein n=1 Tax=Glycomyces salinus TaxID=980294 RepID=UPI0018EB66FA|nr:hypothetical protein [Glycomyces salinus]